MTADGGQAPARRVALVTGASSGIGAATAVGLAVDGCDVLITGRNADGLAATGALVEGAGGRCEVRVGDVTEPDFCRSLVADTVAAFGRLDVVANVAGVIVRGDVTETTDDQWRHTMAANLDSVFFLSRAAVHVMRPQGSGAILNLASNVGIVGSANLPAYCASKGAVIQLTKAMALDHASEGIRVNAVCPGAVDTPMLVSGHERTGTTPDEVFASNIASIPQGRVATPDEIAAAMVFLAGRGAAHITGVALPVDGGYLAQ